MTVATPGRNSLLFLGEGAGLAIYIGCSAFILELQGVKASNIGVYSVIDSNIFILAKSCSHPLFTDNVAACTVFLAYHYNPKKVGSLVGHGVACIHCIQHLHMTCDGAIQKVKDMQSKHPPKNTRESVHDRHLSYYDQGGVEDSHC